MRNDEDAGNSFVAQSLHTETATVSAQVDKPSTCKFYWAQRKPLSQPELTTLHRIVCEWRRQYREKEGDTKISSEEAVRFMRVIGLQGAKYAMETYWKDQTFETKGQRCGVSVLSIRQSQPIDCVQASRIKLLAGEFRRELIHLLSAATLADEDRNMSLNPLVAWMAAAGGATATETADVLINKHRVATEYASLKQKDIKNDSATFGPNRLYWEVVIQAV